ncbi:unnamed protein product, partial [Allacma fusca]
TGRPCKSKWTKNTKRYPADRIAAAMPAFVEFRTVGTAKAGKLKEACTNNWGENSCLT